MNTPKLIEANQLVPPAKVMAELMKIPCQIDRFHALVGAYIVTWDALQAERAMRENLYEAAGRGGVN